MVKPDPFKKQDAVALGMVTGGVTVSFLQEDKERHSVMIEKSRTGYFIFTKLRTFDRMLDGQPTEK